MLHFLFILISYLLRIIHAFPFLVRLQIKLEGLQVHRHSKMDKFSTVRSIGLLVDDTILKSDGAVGEARSMLAAYCLDDI